MKNIIIVIAIIIILLDSNSCKPKEKQLDTLIFKDSTQQVEDSLLVLMQLASIIPGGCNKFYVGGDGYSLNNLFVNEIKIKNIDSIRDYNELKNYDVFKNHSANEIKRMIKLLHYLSDNYIDGLGRIHHLNKFIFDYHPLLHGRYEDSRSIFYLDDEELIKRNDFLSYYQILDRKGKLILVAPADVKIKGK